MKNINYLLIIVAFFALVFSACKYEEGPGISFRQKRQRIANEWMVTNYQVDGAVDDAILKSFTSGDSIQLIFIINQNGGYMVNSQYTKSYADSKSGSKLIPSNQKDPDGFKTNNAMFKRIGSQGKWTFDKKHKNVNFGAIDLSHTPEEDRPLECEIIMLKNDMLKLSFLGLDGKTNLVTYEPRNE